MDKSMDKNYIVVADTNGKAGNNTTFSTPFWFPILYLPTPFLGDCLLHNWVVT